MAGKNESRRSYLTLTALEPITRQPCEIQISFERMQSVGRRSMGHAKECGMIVPAFFQQPSAVFEGLRSDEDEDRQGVGWRCYCGVPDRAYHSDGTPRDAYPGQVYLVFVNDERVAYNWRWERADDDDPTLPVNHSSRFRRRLL